jgi:ABC-type nitrate/sulfonate/bicarbonate transport system substrate-binding protein
MKSLPANRHGRRRARAAGPDPDRRQFLLRTAKTAGGILLADMVFTRRSALSAPAVVTSQFTDWGWPQPYESISKKSQDWLRSQGWWPLSGGWVVVWSGEELVGSIMQDQKLLEKRGIETNWNTFVAAGYSNEAFIPGRVQLANTGALGVLVLLSNRVPMEAVAVHSPAITHAATVPLDSPLKSLSDLKGAKVLGRPAVVGVTTGSTNHFAFIGAANYLGLQENRDYTLKSSPPGDLATAPRGLDVITIWEPHVSYSTEVLRAARLLESLNPYYIYSGYCYARGEIGKNAPEVMQAITDAYIESVLWARANPDKAVQGLMSRSAYAHQKPELIKRMSELYFLWPKPTVYYPFKDREGIWVREEARISAWAYQSGAIRTNVSVDDWTSVRKPNYMDATFEKLGWRVPDWPAFLPKDFGGVGKLPYKPYGAELLHGQAPFPEPGDLVKPWSFMGKTFHP